MTNVPAPWAFALLALAVYRIYRLLARDTLTEPVRAAVSYPDGEAVTLDGVSRVSSPVERGKPLRVYVSTLLRCPWCVGFYVSSAWWAAWLAWPHATLIIAVPWALSAVTGLVAKNLDP